MEEPRGSLLEAAPPDGEGVATPPPVEALAGGALPVKRLRGPDGLSAATGTDVRPAGLVRPETACWLSQVRARGDVPGKFP